MRSMVSYIKEGIQIEDILKQNPNTVRAIKCRRLRWAGHVARMKEGRSAFKILTGKPTRKRPLESLGVDGGHY